jgi:hypothetical protein
MKLLIAVDSFALSSLVVVSESGDVLRSGTALPSLNAGREIFTLSSGRIQGSCHRLQENLRDKACGEGEVF